MIQAGFIQGAVQDWPATRVLCLTHVKELIAQNFAALIRAWPSAPAEIYSAGLNRKRIGQITFAGVQSFVRMTDRGAAGHWDLLIVDEAHLIPAKGATTYRKVINALLAVNPIGSTAGGSMPGTTRCSMASATTFGSKCWSSGDTSRH
jgi:DNA repair protein RadD